MENEERKYVKDIADMNSDFSQWYTDIVLKAELVDYAPVKGFMIIRPYGYAIWENLKSILDEKIKKTGHQNAYFPLMIPESMLNKEKEHVEGFAPEVAWVTHGGENKLGERLCIRPTSETIICTMYSKWVKSYRDLPVMINQWANVVRWEKTTRPFLRTAEFLWQEGHTLHETKEEAVAETMKMLDVYADVFENYLAIPVIKGRKSDKEKFAGAEATYTIEAMMHDGKALQSGTSHYFGNGFAKAFDIKYQSRDGKMEYPFQTSWGMSTRAIGGIIMTHADERGLKLPPKVAPIQIVIVPFAQNKGNVLDKVEDIYNNLNCQYRVQKDTREDVTSGYKCNHWELRGVPIRIEIGPKDIEKAECTVFRRDTCTKEQVKLSELTNYIGELLDKIQQNMYDMAILNRKDKTYVSENFEEYKQIYAQKEGFTEIYWCNDVECEKKLKDETGCTIRCILEENIKDDKKCCICGRHAKVKVTTAKQY